MESWNLNIDKETKAKVEHLRILWGEHGASAVVRRLLAIAFADKKVKADLSTAPTASNVMEQRHD